MRPLGVSSYRSIAVLAAHLIVAAHAKADAPLAYETIQPSRILLGESATLRVTSLESNLKSITLPAVAGLTFEVVDRTQQLEFINGTSIPSTSILIRVTPQIAGIFSIPGLTPKSEPLILEVDAGNTNAGPSKEGGHKEPSASSLLASGSLPRGVQLKAGGAAFVQLVVPTRPMYVGESVPVDIEVGVRPGIVTALNGPPTLNGGEFTLHNLSKQPERQERILAGGSFLVLTWHSVMAAVKPGDFSLSVDTPLTVRINTQSSEDMAFARWLGGPFLQNMYTGIVPKDVTIASPATELKVLPLPTEGRPADFSGAVGNFKIASDVSDANAAVGDPLTLRLHISGVGNFDRVDSPMLDHLEQWKTYPAKSSFVPTDSVGYKGEKVFEQPLIPAQAGAQSIPGLTFSYFDPQTQHYERARTAPIKVTVAASLADRSLRAPTDAKSPSTALTSEFIHGLRPDHPLAQSSASSLRPLYFQARFLALPATLALIFAGTWLGVRTRPERAASRAAARVLAELDAAARSGDASSFFNTARAALSKTLAARWQVSAEQLTAAELHARLGNEGGDIGRLFALADEAMYSGNPAGRTDFPAWRKIVRRALDAEEV
jgi:BatD DUF11 like domain